MINCAASDGFEISPRFRRTVEERIERLEKDAAFDEAQVSLLEDGDHIRRHEAVPGSRQDPLASATDPAVKNREEGIGEGH
jgi:hypothetical protein